MTKPHPIILKIEKDNGLVLKLWDFCDAMSQISIWWLEDGLMLKISDIHKHKNEVPSTILKVTEDDEPSSEIPGIFCGVVGQIYLMVRG